MATMDQLYQGVIIEHDRSPRNFRKLDAPTHHIEARNPLCGDEVTLQLVIEGDRIVDAAWTGQGCMISQSSASILAEQAPGLTVAELEERIASFRASMRSRGELPVDEELLGDAVALEGASRFVARVKCALLPWVAAEAALAER